MDATRLWPLDGVVQRYDWGSCSAIPEFLGVAPDGDPQAELWFGAHPKAPSRVGGDTGAQRLDAAIAADPAAWLGSRVAVRFEERLPFLLKILAAAEPLSIQAHPDARQARDGFAREEAAGIARDAAHRNYRDASHKPELVVAVSRFRALNRFRAPEDTLARLRRLEVSALEPFLAPLATDEGVRGFFEGWMRADRSAQQRCVGEAARAAEGFADADAAYAEVVALQRGFPGDPGVLAPLFLHYVELAPGEGMFLPAGELHAYLEGTAIEVMANSDNVLRGGLTSKHVDTAELLSVLTYRSGEVERLTPRFGTPGEGHYVTPAPEFVLSSVSVDGGWSSGPRSEPEIWVGLEGNLQASGDISLAPGRAFVAPAASGPFEVTGVGRAVRVRPGLGDALAVE